MTSAGASAATDTQPSRIDITNRLTLQLPGIGLLAVVVTGLLPAIVGPVGSLGMVVVFLPYGLVLWLAVHAVFAALEDLLELKLGERS